MLEKLLWCASMALLIAVAWPRGARSLGVEPAAWRPPPPKEVTCGAPVEVVGALPDPIATSDRDGEVVWLRNVGPSWVELNGWHLVSRARSRSLDDVLLAPGERVALVGPALRPLRLTNADGEVRIRDPCGVSSGIAWQTSLGGWAELSEREYPSAPWDPSVPEE